MTRITFYQFDHPGVPVEDRFWDHPGKAMPGWLFELHDDGTADIIIEAGGMCYEDVDGALHYGRGMLRNVPHGTRPGQWERVP